MVSHHTSPTRLPLHIETIPVFAERGYGIKVLLLAITDCFEVNTQNHRDQGLLLNLFCICRHENAHVTPISGLSGIAIRDLKWYLEADARSDGYAKHSETVG